jgi:hypothetical protein
VTRPALVDDDAPAHSHALDLLKAQHVEIARHFADFRDADSLIARQAIATRLCDELSGHLRLKEEVFYPAFVAAVADPWTCDAALAEHADARGLIVRIQASDAMHGEEFDLLVRQLESLFHRQCGEEEKPGGMFDRIERSGQDLHELGMRMDERWKQLAPRS